MTALFTRSGLQVSQNILHDEKGRPFIVERKICSRCGGDGVWKGHYNGVCYGCGGSGSTGTRRVKLYTVEQNAKLDKAQAKRDAKRRAEAEAAATIRAQVAQFAREIFDAEFPGIDYRIEALVADARLDSDKPSFAEEMSERLELWGTLTPKQAAAVYQAYDRKVAQETAHEAAQDVPEGRVEIEGEVVTTRWQADHYSYTGGEVKKFLVVDDRGFKVWGTVPRAIIEAEKGDRVRFVATTSPSDDDPKFGFYKRPSKAEITSQADA